MKFGIGHSVLAAAFLMSANAMAVDLETDAQKLGYIIGLDIGSSFRQQETKVDLDSFFEAVRTSYEGGTPAMTAEEIQLVKDNYIAKRQAEMAAQQEAQGEGNLQAGAQFLAENAKQEGVMVTASGLQYKVLEQGTGAKPAATDTVKVHYRGTLLDGTEFDSSYARNEPISFALDRVISGWTEGVQLMPVGSKYMFYIKPELGYGASGGGPIPPNSTLIFEVELLDIESGE